MKPASLPGSFFFVDGLDEYDGEHVDIINVLRRFASSPSFKLCVSSRPWNVFVEAIGGNTGQKMLLEGMKHVELVAVLWRAAGLAIYTGESARLISQHLLCLLRNARLAFRPRYPASRQSLSPSCLDQPG